MRKPSTERLNWVKKELFEGKKKTGFSVVLDEKYKEQKMFRIKYPDADLSADFYNITRAKDHTIKEFLLTQGGEGLGGTVHSLE